LGSLTGGSFFLTIVAQFFLGQIIKFLWPLFNIIQLVLCFIAFDISFPPNVNRIFTQVKDSIEMNFIPKEKIMDQVKEHASGYATQIEEIQKSGGLLVLVVLPSVVLLLVIVVLLVKCSKSPKCSCMK
jgi:hypothetical protein